jgi:hypothetical protein
MAKEAEHDHSRHQAAMPASYEPSFEARQDNGEVVRSELVNV